MPKPVFHHARCCRENTGCLREGQLSRPPQLCYFPDKHLTGHVPRGAVGRDITTKILGAGHYPESGMSANPWIQVCNILSRVHFLLSVVFPPQFVQVVQVWGKKKASLFCFVGYISMGCCSLKSTAALLPGKHARPPGLKFVLYGWPDYIL